jgi:PAS domain S-box-containing protein
MKPSFFRTELKFSIWMATLVVVILIFLLALTVNNAREKAIVEQFSRQQATIAGSVANGIEDLIVNIEKSALLLSSLHCGEYTAPPETARSLQAIYDFLLGKIQIIAALNEEGTVICGYPDSHMKGIVGNSFKEYPFFEKMKASRKPYIGKPIIREVDHAEGYDAETDSIVIGVPKWNKEGAFTGAVLATISIQTIVDRYMGPARGLSPNDFFLVDENGTVISNSNPDIIGATARITEGTVTVPIDEYFPRENKGYGISLHRNNQGKTKKIIIGYAPIRMSENLWSFAVVTPYDKVILLLRKTSGNIMLGALGLIIAVIITGVSIARSSARSVRFMEQLKRLQEREEWQGRLLREKKTIEGITEGSPIPTFVINREHRIILWNRACAELTGYGAEEMIGTDRHYHPFYKQKRPLIADFIIDQDIEGLEKCYKKQGITKSKSVEGAYEARDLFKGLDGKSRHLYFLAAPIYDEKGEITAVIETLQDVSNEVAMANNLREYAETIQREKKTIEGITEGSPIPTFVLNREHKIILWNRACAELTGYGAEEMIGTDRHYHPFYNEKRPVIADFIIDQDIGGLENYYGTKKIRKSERVKGAYEATDFFKNLGGKDRHLYFLAAPIYDDKREITAVIETLQDISAEREMAQNLRKFAENLQRELTENINLRKEIEELYNYLQSIVDNLPEKIFDISGDGIINFVSRDIKKERAAGADSSEIKGKHFTDFVEPEHREYVLEKWEAAKKGIFLPYELEVTARDRSRRSLLITPSPVKGTDRYVLVQRDVTELKNLEKKYYESQKLAAVGQLSAGIAHEVRNPLSSIKMSLQILEKRIKPSGNDLKRFRIAQREVEHLEKLVNDVLIFARPSAPKKEPSDIKGILDHALAMAEKSLSDKRIKVIKRFEKKIPLIESDPAMLEQTFLNVYHNAIDAMETEGTLLISAKRLSHDKEHVIVEIDDNGCGIDKEDLAHLFNPFFTKKRYGTGLGLSQVKKIIELHGGTVEILSKRGEGTRFRVTLPIGTKNPNEN